MYSSVLLDRIPSMNGTVFYKFGLAGQNERKNTQVKSHVLDEA